ncbi:hypothetical protein V8C86DRAFT_2646004 [Haematococcus lacustris]
MLIFHASMFFAGSAGVVMQARHAAPPGDLAFPYCLPATPTVTARLPGWQAARRWAGRERRRSGRPCAPGGQGVASGVQVATQGAQQSPAAWARTRPGAWGQRAVCCAACHCTSCRLLLT